ncbi:cyclin-like protein [Thozetella sp. PMI_491]|nr:cyclin-like protein [Thozetella sp. PMI_491]
MAPSQMTPSTSKDGGPPTPDEPTNPLGPPSGIFSIPTQYICAQSVKQQLQSIGYDEAREDNYRLKGVQLIDNVRLSLQLPVKTFDTAATYYHKFRIRFPSAEYNYEDAALACLFVACKVEDTIKKSKEILCAAHNLRQPHDHRTPDDKSFEGFSKITIGLERHILETIGFDFRVQYPQKLLSKMVRKLFPASAAKEFQKLAYDMSIDLFKTFAPIKQSTFTMVLGIIELTALISGAGEDVVRGLDPAAYHTDRACVTETMLDLLDLYTRFHKQTKIGAKFDLNKLIDIKIGINNRPQEGSRSRFEARCVRCEKEAEEQQPAPITPGSATSPANNGALPAATKSVKRNRESETTMRFVFDAEEARRERDRAAEHLFDEYEEYEVEVDEAIPTKPKNHDGGQGHGHGHGHGHGRGPHRGYGNNQHDHGFAPYPRNRHGHHDRHKGRKGHGQY